MIKIDEIKIYEDIDDQEVIRKALKKTGINPQDVLSSEIIKKSIDARDKKNVHYSYSILVEVKDEGKYPRLKKTEKPAKLQPVCTRTSNYRPVIVGAGPAGLFCALTLIDAGLKPIIVEQGSPVEQRMIDVKQYRKSGMLNERSNVQFGEGGAGTFSDGKLNTGIHSIYINHVLQTFYRFGAPKEVTYLATPHIGTDYLVQILVNIRHYIESKGGQYYFNCKFTDYQLEDEKIIVSCENQQFETDALVLAVGHSARDCLRMLQKHDVTMKRKDFAVGVRIEHKQEMINKAQYGEVTKLNLPAANYKLVYHGEKRSCYSFCMCPGGEVIASASEKGHIVTNGMSEFARDGENANAALLVNIKTDDFDGNDVFAGVYFQDELEKAAYKLGGSNNYAPVQRVEDFEKGVVTGKIGEVKPTYKPGYTLADLNTILPEAVSQTLKEALPYFDKKVKGFNHPDAILTGVETRTSSPITIVRNEDLHLENCFIYPCGEGAGYAGGITSAAIDGIKVAVKILENN